MAGTAPWQVVRIRTTCQMPVPTHPAGVTKDQGDMP